MIVSSSLNRLPGPKFTNHEITIDAYFIEKFHSRCSNRRLSTIYPRGREFLPRKARCELSNSKREATISILARVKKTELLKSRSSLTNHGRMQRGCELVSRFIPRRVPQRFLEAEDIKRRNTFPFRREFIVRLIFQPSSKILLAGIGRDEVKPFPFPPDLFRSNKHPYSEEIRFITLVVPSTSCHSSLDKCTLLSSSTRGGHPWWNYSYEK